jgi:hypothetical protein
MQRPVYAHIYIHAHSRLACAGACSRSECSAAAAAPGPRSCCLLPHPPSHRLHWHASTLHRATAKPQANPTLRPRGPLAALAERKSGESPPQRAAARAARGCSGRARPCLTSTRRQHVSCSDATRAYTTAAVRCGCKQPLLLIGGRRRQTRRAFACCRVLGAFGTSVFRTVFG